MVGLSSVLRWAQLLHNKAAGAGLRREQSAMSTGSGAKGSVRAERPAGSRDVRVPAVLSACLPHCAPGDSGRARGPQRMCSAGLTKVSL